MFLLRSVKPSDFEQVLALSSMLNQINLSTVPEELQRQIENSLAAFKGAISNKAQAEYIFCLEDTDTKKLVGTSMIMAQHGTKESPHYFFQVARIEKFSQSIHSGIVHQILKLGYDTDGPTEVGGLILHPAFRHSFKNFVKILSFGLFLYIAMHRRRFNDRVIAEFLPPFTPEGKSLLWEALGRKFTNLSYIEADKISRKHKEFITSLFPMQTIYLCLLDAKTRAMIGQIDENTIPAVKMLEGLGFKYLSMIDPFDGGPHYGARMKDISLIKSTKGYRFKKGTVRKFKEWGLVARERDCEFRLIASHYFLTPKFIHLPLEAQSALDLESNERIYVAPLSLRPNGRKK